MARPGALFPGVVQMTGAIAGAGPQRYPLSDPDWMTLMPGTYEADRYCDLFERESRLFCELIGGADPALPVPTCGRWSLRDLVTHVGHIQLWGGKMVADLAQARHPRKKADMPQPPADGLAPWLSSCTSSVLPALRAADPQARMWAWGPDKHARFWPRRLLHETAVHRGDAVLALGDSPVYEPLVAADGIAEFLENLPKGSSRRRGDGERIHFDATDHPYGWTVTLTPAGHRWTADPGTAAEGHPPRQVTLHGTVDDLYLLMWGRRAIADERFTVTGDLGLLTYWAANSSL